MMLLLEFVAVELEGEYLIWLIWRLGSFQGFSFSIYWSRRRFSCDLLVGT